MDRSGRPKKMNENQRKLAHGCSRKEIQYAKLPALLAFTLRLSTPSSHTFHLIRYAMVTRHPQQGLGSLQTQTQSIADLSMLLWSAGLDGFLLVDLIAVSIGQSMS